jgi:hypothetical protein
MYAQCYPYPVNPFIHTKDPFNAPVLLTDDLHCVDIISCPCEDRTPSKGRCVEGSIYKCYTMTMTRCTCTCRDHFVPAVRG